MQKNRYPAHIQPSDLKQTIDRAVQILKTGGVIAYPTDTVYGLGAIMNNQPAVERIFEIKDRPKGMALPLLLSNVSQILEIAVPVPEVWRLAAAFFPGALTIILVKSPSVPDSVTAGARTVAFRIPNHPVPLALIQKTGSPIVGTSANLSAHPSALTATEVAAQIGEKVDMIIDGGKTPGGVESTIIDLTGEKPVIIRQGAIPLKKIKEILPDTISFEEINNANRNR